MLDQIPEEEISITFYNGKAGYFSKMFRGNEHPIYFQKLGASEKVIFDPNLNTSWRSSANDGGNPGTFDNTQFEGDELIKYAFNDFATQQIEIQNGYIIFNYQKNLLADDITVIPQKSNDLQKWYNVEAFEVISQIKLDKNTANISLKIDNRNENDSSSMKYFRLKLNIIN